jgi:hypothetical protein
MGICAGKAEGHGEPLSSGASPAEVSPEQKQQIEAEFRTIMEKITLMVLRKCAQAIEFESIGFQDVAQARNLENYFDVFGPEHFEAVLKEFWTIDVAGLEAKQQAISGKNASSHKFFLLLDACDDATIKSEKTVAEIKKAFQKAATLTRKDLDESDGQALSSDLKIHLKFFANCFTFCQGDIEDPKVLAQNVDTILDADQLG